MDRVWYFLTEYCIEGEIEKLQCLLTEYDLNLINEMANESGAQFPIHLAAQYNQISVIDLLLKLGEDVDKKDKWGETPLHVASRNGFPELCDFLILNGADMYWRDCYVQQAPLADALEFHHNDVVRIFIKNGIDLSSQSVYSPCSKETIRDDVCKKTNLVDSILYKFLHENNVEMIEFFNTHGINLANGNVEGFTLLHVASENGFDEMVSLLLDCALDVDTLSLHSGETALHVAAKNGRLSTIKLLCQNGANVNAQDVNGNTPLLAAAKNGQIEVVDALCKIGANINAQNLWGDTALHHCEHLHVLKMLLLKGIDTEVRNNKDQMAFETLSDDMKFFYEFSLKEITSMKNIQLNKLCRLYDVFFMNSDEMSRYVNNATLAKLFSWSVGAGSTYYDYSWDFPNYGDNLYKQYLQGVKSKREGYTDVICDQLACVKW